MSFMFCECTAFVVALQTRSIASDPDGFNNHLLIFLARASQVTRGQALDHQNPDTSLNL